MAPGPVATELFLKEKTQAQIEQFIKLAPLQRLGQPDDVTNVVSFLAGPNGAWVNGQVLRANGSFALSRALTSAPEQSFKKEKTQYEQRRRYAGNSPHAEISAPIFMSSLVISES